MNNLTTRKIVLGLLMALVLAFSVQGIAEALTVSSPKGDLQNVQTGGEFSISFGVKLSSDIADESIEIGVTNATIKTVEGSDPDSDDTHAMEEEDDDTDTFTGNNKLTTTTINVVLTAGATASNIEITVTDATLQETVLEFDAYSVPDSAISADAPTFAADADADPGYRVGVTEVHINTFLEVGENLPLRYRVSGGSLSVKENGRSRSINKDGKDITSSSAPVFLNMGGKTSVVSVYVEGHGSDRSARTTIIFRYPRLSKVSGDSPKQLGAASSRLLHPFTVQVRDGSGSTGKPVPGQEVTFATSAPASSIFAAHPDFPDAAINTGIPAGAPQTALSNDLSDDSDSSAVVTTNSQGNASVFLVLGSISVGEDEEEHTVEARIGPSNTPAALQVEFEAKAVIEAEASSLAKVAKTDGQRANAFGRLDKPLTVIVLDQGGNPKQGAQVMFQDRSGGTLSFLSGDPGSPASADSAANLRTRLIDTDASGKASIRYKAREGGGTQTVSASVTEGGYQSMVFTINGTPSTGDGGGSGGGDDDDIITFSRTSITGEAGDEEDIRVTSTPSGVVVSLSSPDFANSNFSPQSETTPFTTTLTLPDETGSHDIFATRTRFTPAEGTVTVEAEGLGTLTISPSGTPVNGEQRVNITARTSGGAIPAGAVPVTLSGTGFTTTIATVLTGSVIHPIVLPTVAGTYTLTASATGYNSASTILVVGTTTPASTTPAPTVTATPSSIQISGPAQRSGTVNQQLDSPLLVRVLGNGGTGVANARVIFRVISGRGRLSERGNGRAVGVQTDSSGYARANFTPTDGGAITVRASTDDISATVEFTITTGAASTTTTTTRTPGTGVTPSTSVSPVVHVGAASRPPMLWVDGGAIYALVGASPQRFAPGVDNALNITVGGGKVYWTEKTGDAGTINSANLNGSDVTELTSIKAVPMGIAVDVAGSQLYWTNSRGRIQSADLDGSGITNVMQNLPSPMDLALAGGNAYWTQGNGSVRFVNLRGQKVVRNVSTGTDTPGSLVIGGGKVYWTEMTGESGGTVNSANLNGTGATQLASILAAPMGIAVDGSRSKLYWSNSRGRIQSANLDGSGITNVVSGLGSPGDMVLSNSISAPAATTTTRTTTTASNKYDVNGDGSVNNADSDAITVAIAAGATDAKYDVNGDGTVNVFDLVEIIANRDPGAAGAPTLFGMKMSAAQIDSLQEQIDLLIAMNDRSPAALRTLIYLQQLLVTARPEKTLLLANYPNPFNPETWIPYELATDTDVRITIYNTQGVVIRTLQLGHQSAGYYTGRDRAAYWDGRNALGEQVASGLYFYQLETDEMSLMRKMVILK